MKRQPTLTRQAYPTDLTDAQWKVLEPLLPAAAARGRPREHTLREIVNAIFYITDNCLKWRAMPHDLPPWQSVYYYFRGWVKQGLWEPLNTRLREQVRVAAGREAQPSAAILDSQSVPTTEMAAPETIGYDANKHIKGRKRHLLVDTMGLVLKVVVLGASISDPAGARVLLSPIRQHFQRLALIWADAVYGGPGLSRL